MKAAEALKAREAAAASHKAQEQLRAAKEEALRAVREWRSISALPTASNLPLISL